MRLTENERNCIKKVIYTLDPHATIYLFGSRTDDSKKGGDIDLLVMSQIITEKNKRDIKLKLYDALGEQKIDLLIAQNTSDPFTQIAFNTGIKL